MVRWEETKKKTTAERVKFSPNLSYLSVKSAVPRYSAPEIQRDKDADKRNAFEPGEDDFGHVLGEARAASAGILEEIKYTDVGNSVESAGERGEGGGEDARAERKWYRRRHGECLVREQRAKTSHVVAHMWWLS